MLAAENILAALPDAAVLLEKSGKVIFANETASHLLGTSLEGLDITGLLRAPSFRDALQKCHSGKQDLQLNLGRNQVVECHLSILPNGEKILLVMRDLSHAQAIEKMRVDFVANASHELRTPLTSIMATIETLMGPAKNDGKARVGFLSGMMGQAKRMRRLIDDLLTLSQIELSEKILPLGSVSLFEVAQQAKDHLSALAKEAGLKIFVTEMEPARVIGDSDQLLQVALNLLENAVKYGGTGSAIEVVVKAELGFGILTVRDYGPGIAEEHLPRLTERFYRANIGTAKTKGGTGLGLAIVKHIVARHRGNLQIATSQGDGSEFSVKIPLQLQIDKLS